MKQVYSSIENDPLLEMTTGKMVKLIALNTSCKFTLR